MMSAGLKGTASLRVLLFLTFVALMPLAAADSGSDRQRLLEMQALQQKAHVERDAGLVVSMFADDFVSISDGAVEKASRDTHRRNFEEYFAAVELLEWADVAPPDIVVSDDGTMATVTVLKRVHVRSVTDPERAEQTQFAWLEVWRKQNGEWKLATIASTRSAAPDGTRSP